MLVIVEDRNVHFFLKALLNDETLRRLDILKVNAAKCRTHQSHSFAELICVFRIKLNVDRVHVGEAFKENRLALHHRLTAQRTKITETQNSRTV